MTNLLSSHVLEYVTAFSVLDASGSRYNRYLMVHWFLCFILSFESFLHYSPCDAWVPPSALASMPRAL